MTSGDYEKDIQERINLISSLVKKSFIDYKELLEEKDFKKYIGTQYFEEQFQTVRINLPMRRGIPDAAISIQEEYPFSFLIVCDENIRESWHRTLPQKVEDIFSKNDVLKCKTPTEIHRSLANLRGLDLIIVLNTQLTKIDLHDIFSMYKPKLIVLLGACDA